MRHELQVGPPWGTAMNSPIAQAQVEEAHETFADLRREVAKVMVGQEEVVGRVIVCLLCRGHALLVWVPGLGQDVAGLDSGPHVDSGTCCERSGHGSLASGTRDGARD